MALILYLRRLKCLKRKGGCDATCTVLPSFLHPRRRYLLEEIQPVLKLRFVEEQSYRKMEESLPSPPAPSTQRDWVRSYSLAAGFWLLNLVSWFVRMNPGMALSRSLEKGAPAGLLAQAVLCLDWQLNRRGLPLVEERRVLEGLWLWGSRNLGGLLLPPTRCRAGP